jgi:conjugal transfer/type IV secretion protein DotA/TraY
MTTIRSFLTVALVALAIVGIGAGAAPAEAQVAGTAPSTNELRAAVEKDPMAAASGLFRWSIPGGDYIAQSIFSIIPTAELAGSARPAGETATTSKPVASAIGEIVGFLNVLILILCIAIAMTSAIEWLVNMGRTGKWENESASAWAPVRFSLALMAIVPIPGGGGFNAAQYAFGTLARGGYAAGGMAWNFAVAQSTTAARMPIVPPLNPQIPQMVANVGLIEVCRALADGRSYEHFGTPASARVAQWIVEDSNSATRWATRFDRVVLGQTQIDVTWLVNWISACGDITLQKGADSNGQLSLGYRVHREAIEETRALAAGMANRVLTAYFDNRASRDREIGLAVEAYMSTAPRAYAARVATAASNILSQNIQNAAAAGRSTAESQFAETARYAGWSNAGAFFMSYARVSTNAAQVASIIPAVTPPVWERIRKIYGEGLFDAQIGPAGLIEAYRRNISQYIDPSAPDWTRAGLGGQSGNPNSTSTTSDSSRVLGVVPGVTAANNWVMTSVQDLMRTFIDPAYRGANGFNPNALQTQVETGHKMMVAGTVLLTASFITGESIAAAADNAGGAARLIPGLGTAISAAAGAAKGAAKMTIFMGETVGAALIGLGALWAYLTPALIAFAWYASVLGWIMLLLESMLVASLAGVANMNSGNEPSIWSSKASHTLGVLFNIIFRPILMTAGMILAVFSYNIMASAVSNGIFGYAVPSMLGDSLYGPIGFVTMLLALTIFNLSMIAWLGSLPNYISENVPLWLGLNAGPNYHSSQAVAQMTNLGTVGGAHATKGTLSSAAGAVKAYQESKKAGENTKTASLADSGRQAPVAPIAPPKKTD